MRTLIVLCLVLGGMDAFGQEKEEENKRAKKEKKSENWYGIAAGLSQFYLKDELGSYLRYDGQPRSLAGLSLTVGPKNFGSFIFAFGRGKLYASETSVNILYSQIEGLDGRYLASYFAEKVKLGIMGGISVGFYVKEYIHPPIHSQPIGDIDFSLNLAIVGDFRFNARHHLRAYTGSNIVSYYLPHSIGIVSNGEGFSSLLDGDFVFWNRFAHFNIRLQYTNRLFSSIKLYTLYRMDFQRARRYNRTASMFTHHLLLGFAFKVR